MQFSSADNVTGNRGKRFSRLTLTLLPYKSGPGCSSVQTVLVQYNGVSPERCLHSFLFFAFLFWRIRSRETGKETHETEQLFNCLQHKWTSIWRQWGFLYDNNLSNCPLSYYIKSWIHVSVRLLTMKISQWAREHICSYCTKNILTIEQFTMKPCRSSYLWVLVHTNREILKSPLHVGVDGELSSKWARMLTTQPQQTIIRRKYIPVERHHFWFIAGTANTQQDPMKLLAESGK